MDDNKKNPKTQNSIPSSKVQRASRFLRTGVKVGKNYVKHYSRKFQDSTTTKDALHEDNARDVYETLSELKGSALKVAQMMSMDKNLLPTQYADKFQMAQYSAPPLSFPLVVRTFQKSLGKSPADIFDNFTKEAVNAASIGQVHKATYKGKEVAVKVQYPGVADSVSSDLKLVKPFAVRLVGLNEKEVEYYMEEVETMLLSETDYEQELAQSVKISEACSHIPNLYFPKYYPEVSSKRILTMDWLSGTHIDKFMKTDPSQELRNQIGQAMWDFYDYQIHNLLEVHADPHPGNFLIDSEGKLGIIDFGCVKVLPEDFYHNYFALTNKGITNNREGLWKLFLNLNFIHKEDSEADQEQLYSVFATMIDLLMRPFHNDTFDFSKDDYFNELFQFGETSMDVKALRKSKKPRGSRHGLYLNRTYFGLYNLLNQLKAKVNTHSAWYEKQSKAMS